MLNHVTHALICVCVCVSVCIYCVCVTPVWSPVCWHCLCWFSSGPWASSAWQQQICNLGPGPYTLKEWMSTFCPNGWLEISMWAAMRSMAMQSSWKLKAQCQRQQQSTAAEWAEPSICICICICVCMPWHYVTQRWCMWYVPYLLSVCPTAVGPRETHESGGHFIIPVSNKSL